MSDNKEKANKKIPDKLDTIKIVCITLVAMIILPIVFNVFKKEDEFAFNVNTLSSEELAGESYTERTTFDDSDMWETEIPENTGITYAVDSLTKSEIYVEFPIDINLANAEELMLIDGVGTVTAEKIISYRNMYGYFSDYTQLLNVDGIGEKKLNNLMDYIYISEEWLEIPADNSVADETTIVITTPVVQKTATETVTVGKTTITTEDDIVIVNEEFIDDIDEEPEYIDEKYEYEFYFETTTMLHYVNFPLDLNIASVEELMCIDGIGEQTAQNIVNYARQYGFYSVEDLLNVNGIGNSKLAAIMPYVYVNSYLLPPIEETFYQESETVTEITIPRVNVNTCGKSDLMQLPGIDETLADRIIEFRESIGGFLKIEEITLVDGMTNEKMSAIWDYVYI